MLESALFGGKLVSCSLSGVLDDLFECEQVVEVAFAAGGGDAADGLGAGAVVFLEEFDHLFGLEDGEVAAEVAVRERAELFEFVEEQAFGIGDERGEHAEAGALVDDAVESFVGEAAFGGRKSLRG